MAAKLKTWKDRSLPYKVGIGCMGAIVIAIVAPIVLGAIAPSYNRQSLAVVVPQSATPSAADAERLEAEPAIDEKEAIAHARKVIAAFDELRRCSKDPTFTAAGFSVGSTPCPGWMDRAKALQENDAAAISGGFDCLAGDVVQMGLSMLTPRSADSREHITFVTETIKACRERVASSSTSGR